jgi:hypothetical protein
VAVGTTTPPAPTLTSLPPRSWSKYTPSAVGFRKNGIAAARLRADAL